MGFDRWRYVLPLRLRSLFRSNSVDRELDDELQFHIERQIELNVARGMNPAEARHAAIRAMGGVVVPILRSSVSTRSPDRYRLPRPGPVPARHVAALPSLLQSARRV